jgi:acetylornithine deacetylase
MTDIDEIYYDSIDLLKGMIAIPSFSRNEEEVATYVENALKKFKLNPKRSGNNLWCIAPSFDINRPTILLDAHLDTVKVTDGWQHDPFTPTEEEGRLYGLGSNDDGASVVSLLGAFRFLAETSQAYNLIFLASCEEEVCGKNGIESVLPQLPPIAVAIAGEPTGMQPAVAEKGLMVLDGSIHGVAGHAAREGGVNSIYKAIDAINDLRNLKFDKESAMLGPVKVTVTQINAGIQHNVIPDLCTIVVDVRTTDAYSNIETLEIIKSHVSNCELKERSTRLNPSCISLEHPLVSRATIMGKQPFGSPTLSNQALMPFPSLKMGPGDSKRSHTADEYIELSEIREAIDTYITLLNGIQL